MKGQAADCIFKKPAVTIHFGTGNVRELKSVIELAVVMSGTEEIGADDIFFGSNASAIPSGHHESGELTLKEFEERLIRSYLQKYDNNVKLVAEKLDIGQSTIYRMLKIEKESE